MFIHKKNILMLALSNTDDMLNYNTRIGLLTVNICKTFNVLAFIVQ